MGWDFSRAVDCQQNQRGPIGMGFNPSLDPRREVLSCHSAASFGFVSLRW